ncbi:hypothetical protein, partial [Lysinibacillus sphaericus]|uniref:hypothetical protein n=1 Tax=Lysinibacillus sphaericus TaxID=1421 RepID=UPI001E336038
KTRVRLPPSPYIKVSNIIAVYKNKGSSSEMCADTDILNTFGYDLFTKLLPKLRLSSTPI